MYIKVQVVAGAKREGIVKESPDHFRISVTEPAERNLANTRVRELLAQEFGIPVKSLRLISGHHSPHKIFSIPD